MSTPPKYTTTPALRALSKEVATAVKIIYQNKNRYHGWFGMTAQLQEAHSTYHDMGTFAGRALFGKHFPPLWHALLQHMVDNNWIKQVAYTCDIAYSKDRDPQPTLLFYIPEYTDLEGVRNLLKRCLGSGLIQTKITYGPLSGISIELNRMAKRTVSIAENAQILFLCGFAVPLDFSAFDTRPFNEVFPVDTTYNINEIIPRAS